MKFINRHDKKTAREEKRPEHRKKGAFAENITQSQDIPSKTYFLFFHSFRPHNRCPGTAQKIIVKAVTNMATRTLTQIALPSSSFFT